MAAVGALRDQELMAQGKDFTLLSCPRSEAGWHAEKQGGKRVNLARATYMPQLYKFNFFNENGLFGRNSYSTLSHIF
jgi:hypothetical protein